MTGPSASGSATSNDTPPPGEGVGVDAPQVEYRRQLREFLATLSGFAPKKSAPEPGEDAAPIRSRRWLLVTCGVVAIVCGGIYLPPLLLRPVEAMPAKLLGAWVTSTPDYADRGFWIGKRQVAFRVGSKPDDVNRYPVIRIRVRRTSGDTTSYDLEYAADGGTNQWSFEYIGSPQPTIVFIHQPEMTWTPTPDQNPPIR